MHIVRKIVFISATIILLNISVFAVSGIFGYVETVSGNKYLVLGKNYNSVEITNTNKENQKPIKLNSEFSVFGDDFKNSDSDAKFDAKYMRISTGNKYKFYVPIFGAKFMKNTSEIYVEGIGGDRHSIALPVEGGTIKGVKILKDGIELMIFEQKTYTKQGKNGKMLYGISRKGENVKIALRMEKIGINDSLLLWAEDGSVYKYIDGKIEKDLKGKDD